MQCELLPVTGVAEMARRIGRTRGEVEPLIAQQGATPLVYYKGAEFYSEADYQRVKAEIEADEGRKHPRRDEEAGIF